jgi:hypothetical protein
MVAIYNMIANDDLEDDKILLSTRRDIEWSGLGYYIIYKY